MPTTKLVFGDAAITLVKKNIFLKKQVVEGGTHPVKKYLSAPVKETSNRSSAIYFGDAKPISVSNSRFRKSTLMAEANIIIPLDGLTGSSRQVIGEVASGRALNTVARAGSPEERTTAMTTSTFSRLQKLLEPKRYTSTTPKDAGKIVPFSSLTIQPKSSTRQKHSVFDTGFVEKYRALIKKNVASKAKMSNVTDEKQFVTQPTDNILQSQIVEDIPIVTGAFSASVIEMKETPPVVAMTDLNFGALLQPEIEIITQLSIVEDSHLQALSTKDRTEAKILHWPSFVSQGSAESSQASVIEYSPGINERVVGVDIPSGEPAVALQPIQDHPIIDNIAMASRKNINTTTLANHSRITAQPRALASGCDYARMFDASVKSSGGKPPNPKPNYIILPIIEPLQIPAVNDMRSLQTIRDVSRQFDLEPPGTETVLGPRNDNDWRGIAKIQVMPTIDELLPGRRTVYMPRKERMFPLARVVDLAFRHYRESSLGPIRDGTADAMRRMVQGVEFPSTTIETAGATYNAYLNAWIERSHCTEGRFASPAFSLAFTSPGHKYIVQDKVLRGGHLLALLTLSGSEVEVVWLKAAEGWSDRDGHGRISAIGMYTPISSTLLP